MKNTSILLLVLSLAACSPQANDPAQNQPAQNETAQCFARFVPERNDDFAWENDKIAFRAYGPFYRGKAVNSGIDAWLKRVPYPIIDKWYKENQEGKSYHEDHGEGLDNYHVGSSAGVGGSGLWLDGKREHLDTFTKYEVLESSPERYRFKLTYEREINGVTYGEEKTFTVELGKRLFDVSSKFTADGKPAAELPICIGVTTHDGKATASHNKDKRWIACWEVLDGHGLGTGARLGEGYPIEIKEVSSEKKDESHIFILTQTDKDGALTYQAGYGWEKAGEITTPSQWEEYLSTTP
jgi:hypothetical protein